MERLNRLFLPFVILLCCLQLYTGIAGKDLQQWDEARNGVNAYEMLQHGDLSIFIMAQLCSPSNMRETIV